MKKSALVVAILVSAAIAPAVYAKTTATKTVSAKAHKSKTSVFVIKATIVALDSANRTAGLEIDGQPVAVTLDPKIDMDKLSIGDTIDASLTITRKIELLENTGKKGMHTMESKGPQGVDFVDTFEALLKIVEVNSAKHEVLLEGPRGGKWLVDEITPALMSKVKVGNQVRVTVSVGAMVGVQPVAEKKD